jgi:hypothetical protein
MSFFIFFNALMIGLDEFRQSPDKASATRRARIARLRPLA